MEEVLAALERTNTDFTQGIRGTIMAMSPTSCKVTLRQVCTHTLLPGYLLPQRVEECVRVRMSSASFYCMVRGLRPAFARWCVEERFRAGGQQTDATFRFGKAHSLTWVSASRWRSGWHAVLWYAESCMMVLEEFRGISGRVTCLVSGVCRPTASYCIWHLHERWFSFVILNLHHIGISVFSAGEERFL
jgi:hypothetical protein